MVKFYILFSKCLMFNCFKVFNIVISFNMYYIMSLTKWLWSRTMKALIKYIHINSSTNPLRSFHWTTTQKKPTTKEKINTLQILLSETLPCWLNEIDKDTSLWLEWLINLTIIWQYKAVNIYVNCTLMSIYITLHDIFSLNIFA